MHGNRHPASELGRKIIVISPVCKSQSSAENKKHFLGVEFGKKTEIVPKRMAGQRAQN